MDKQNKYRQQGDTYQAYVKALGIKFDSLGVNSRDVTLSKMEVFLSGVLKLESRPESEEDAFNFSLAQDIRKKAKLGQRELARKLGMAQPTLSTYENGRYNPLRGRKSGAYLNWLRENGYK